MQLPATKFNMQLHRITMVQHGRLTRIITGRPYISSISRDTSAMCISVKDDIKRPKKISRLFWKKFINICHCEEDCWSSRRSDFLAHIETKPDEAISTFEKIASSQRALLAMTVKN